MYWLYKRRSQIGVAVLFIALIAGAYFLYQHFKQPAVTELTPAQVQDAAIVAKAIDEPVSVAKEVVKGINAATKLPPAATYHVAAATTQQATKVVEQQIKTNTAPVSLPKADKTIVTPQEQKVDVYRINLNKAHKIKLGVTVIDNHAYWNFGYQQNRMEYIGHMQGQKFIGATAMWTAAEW